jgi:putative PEP-CTERM system TPR-repeat lipoprotein
MKKTLLTNAVKLSLIGLSATMLIACNPKTSEHYLAEGKQYIAENNDDAAIISLKNALQADPISSDVRFNLAKLYIKTKRYEGAEKELLQAIKFNHDPALVLPLLALAYEKNGTYTELSEIRIEEVGLTPTAKTQVGYYKMLALLRLEKIDDASELIDQMLSLETESTYKTLIAAFKHRLAKENESAESLLLALKEKAPTDQEVLKTLAQVLLTLNKRQEAADIYTEFVKLYPEELKIKFMLSQILVDLGRMDEAETYIDELLVANDQNALLNRLKASVEVTQENFEDAIKYAEMAILNGVNDVDVRLIAGFASYRLSDYDRAVRHLSFVASRLPNNHPSLKILADSQLRTGLTGDAGKVLNRIEGLDQGDAQLLSKVSYQLLRDGYEKNARELIGKASTIGGSAEDLTRLGVLQLSLNDIEGIKTLETAIDVTSDPKEKAGVQSTLVQAYIGSEQYDKALGLVKSWKIGDKNSVEPYMVKGQIHVKRNEIELAKKEYQDALAINAEALDPQMALINLDVLNKDVDSAKQKVENILSQNPSYLPALAINYLLLSKNNEGEKALGRIKSLAANEPQDIGLALLLARIYAGEKKLTESMAALNAISGNDVLPESYWKLKGQVLIALEKMGDAKAHHEAWSLAYPHSKDATINQLLLLDVENDFAKGVEVASKFLEKRSDVQTQILLTHFLIMNRDIKGAKSSYRKLPAGVLETPIAKRFLANFQLADGKAAEALPNALTAYTANPNFRNVVLATVIYDRLEKDKEVLGFLQKHVTDHPSDMKTKMLLAELQYKTDNVAAMRHYEQAVQANPTNYVALNNLAYLNLQQGNIEAAKDYAKDALFLQPDNISIVDTLAMVLMAEKSYSEAVKHYEQADINKEAPEDIYLNYVEALLLNNQFDVAMRRLDQKQFEEAVSRERISELKLNHLL